MECCQRRGYFLSAKLLPDETSAHLLGSNRRQTFRARAWYKNQSLSLVRKSYKMKTSFRCPIHCPTAALREVDTYGWIFQKCVSGLPPPPASWKGRGTVRLPGCVARVTVPRPFRGVTLRRWAPNRGTHVRSNAAAGPRRGTSARNLTHPADEVAHINN